MSEQLLFTWADRGLEGRGMWQVVAASEHLYRRLPRALQLARNLCIEFTYPLHWQDQEKTPVSFGWRDIHGMRFAFRRVYRGSDAFGRPGVFAAHVLVDTPDRLPADRLLDIACSPAWWSGEPRLADEGEWLPGVTLDDFPGGPEDIVGTDGTANVEAVLTALLAHKGRPVRLGMDTSAFRSALGRAAALLPGALDRISVSTYEPPDTRGSYGLTAVQPPDEDPIAITVDALAAAPGLAGHRAAAQLMMNGDARSQAYVRTAWHEVGRTDIFLRLCAAFLAVRAGGTVRLDDVLLALQYPGTAADLLDELPVRAVVAHALGAGDASVVAAMRTVRRSLEAETWASLGELTARAATTKRGLAVAADVIRTSSGPGTTALIRELVQLARSDLSRIVCWPHELLAAIWAERDAHDATSLEAAMVRAGAADVLVLAGQASMPADLWSRLLLEALDTGQVEPGRAAEAVHARPAFARAVRDTSPASVLELLLDSLPAAEALELLSMWVDAARADRWISLAGRVASRLSDGQAWRAAATVAPVLRRPAAAGWSSLRDAALRRQLVHQIDDPRAQPCPLTEICRPELGPPDRAWHGYFRMLSAGGVGIATGVHRLPPDDRELAGRFALYTLVARAVRPTDVAVLADTLASTLNADAEQIAELVLRGGLRGILGRDRWAPGFAALAYVAVWLVEPGRVDRRKMTGELASPAAQRLAVSLRAALAPRDPYLDQRWRDWTQDRPRADRWLRGLAS
jgi:GTPase-associated protein 1, N-terminal domain type 2